MGEEVDEYKRRRQRRKQRDGGGRERARRETGLRGTEERRRRGSTLTCIRGFRLNQGRGPQINSNQRFQAHSFEALPRGTDQLQTGAFPESAWLEQPPLATTGELSSGSEKKPQTKQRRRRRWEATGFGRHARHPQPPSTLRMGIAASRKALEGMTSSRLRKCGGLGGSIRIKCTTGDSATLSNSPTIASHSLGQALLLRVGSR